MPVGPADGSQAVDGVEGGRVRLARRDSPQGEHHHVDGGPVEGVDEHVRPAARASTI